MDLDSLEKVVRVGPAIFNFFCRARAAFYMHIQ